VRLNECECEIWIAVLYVTYYGHITGENGVTVGIFVKT
jgi:hypothetical protein